jgi:hypothetical protein
MPLMFISFFVLYFGTISSYGQFIQLAGVFLFVISIFLLKRRNYLNKINVWIDEISILILILIPLFSIFALVFFGDISLVFQTLIFLVAAFSAKYISLVRSVKSIANVFLNSIILMIVVTLVFQSGKLIESLNLVEEYGSGRIRFSPFDNHPNLTGHIFGMGCVVSFVYSYWMNCKRSLHFYSMVVVCALCFLFVAAASSRGGILATTAGVGGVLFLNWFKNNNIKNILNGGVAVVFLIFIAFVIFDPLGEGGYISELFELNSEYRGVDSGLTGRSDNWPIIVFKSIEDVQGIFLGHGIRSWDTELQGIATDSSYVNQLWESGLILSVLLFFVIFKKLLKLAFGSRSFEKDVVFSVILFSIAESIVARYMLGIGNPASLLILIFLFLKIKNELALK